MSLEGLGQSTIKMSLGGLGQLTIKVALVDFANIDHLDDVGELLKVGQ